MIVGAGPAGAALALLLASRGVAVTLIERQHDFEREFRGELMTPSGLVVLDALGVDLAKAGVPHRAPTEFEIWVERRRVVRLDAASGVFSGRTPLLVSPFGVKLLNALLGLGLALIELSGSFGGFFGFSLFGLFDRS